MHFSIGSACCTFHFPAFLAYFELIKYFVLFLFPFMGLEVKWALTILLGITSIHYTTCTLYLPKSNINWHFYPFFLDNVDIKIL